MFSSNHNFHERLFKEIAKYNVGKAAIDQINFLHGSSSAIFAFTGKAVKVRDNKSGNLTRKIIPPALIPTGVLRKKYGVYPISGELDINAFGYGSRKNGCNYRAISGMGINYDGISVTSTYAQNAKRFPTIDVLHERIQRIIQFMDRAFFARSLRMLLMEMTNLMLLDKNADSRAPEFLSLLDQRFQTICLECEDNASINAYYSKYRAILQKISIKELLPFLTDDVFRSEILHQYPVIFCANAKTIDFYDGIPGEKIFSGELNFSQVKMIFTPFEFVNDLNAKLANLHLSTSIKVLGYAPTNTKQENVVMTENYGADGAVLSYW